MALFTLQVSFCLVSALITYGLGIYVYAKSPSSTVNRLFLAATLTATYWALGEFFLWQAAGYEGVAFWLKASSFWTLAVAFIVHFVLAFTGHPFAEKKNRGILVAALYLPAVLFALIEIFTDRIYTVAFDPVAGYVYLPVQTDLLCQTETAFIILVMLFAASVSISSWRRAQPGPIRRQNRLVSAGIAAVIGFGSLSGAVLPALGIHAPNLVFIGILVFSVVIAYAVHRHGLFVLRPETAVPEIIRTIPDGMILADMNGGIITANASAANLFGVAEADLPGRSVASLIPPAAYAAIMAAVTERGRLSDREAVLAGQGETVVSIAASIVQDPDGGNAGIVLIVRDITDRKAAETALRIANEKISLLTQLTRHDIGNLVTALSWYLSLIAEERTGPQSDACLASAIEVTEKISRHLAFSREYQEIGVHQPAWQPLEALIADAVGSLPDDGVSIVSSVAPVEVYADSLAAKVAYNLLENAIRHAGSLTRILITTEEQPDGSLVVAFDDDGGGVRDEEKEKIFTYGYGKNTGLGLALTREILAVTGIGIAETGTEGAGARFEVRVPDRAWRRPGEKGV
ncbi:PAS domain S-box protein [Methanoculleus sp. FWC-SCC1]|uniref:histidine kinase n=2 Tax=Methanoculleus frigidifontis TaxID=2584085 RepID=A0ABT8MDD7_9EURY|nr:PAS domain S-box protein [Methanoculleus sp. FWC-SCC1]